MAAPKVTHALAQSVAPVPAAPAPAPATSTAAPSAPVNPQGGAANNGGNADTGNGNTGNAGSGANHNSGGSNATPKPPAPMPTLSAQPAAPASTLAHQVAAAPGAGPASTPLANSAPAAPAHPAPAAGMASWQAASASNALQAAPGREMKVSLQSDTLGSVQLHASLHDNVLGATIAVDRPEIHNFLATQMPALERTLEARQLQVGSLQLQQQAAGNANTGSGSNAGTPYQPAPSAPALPFRGDAGVTVSLTSTAVASQLPPGRLNLHA